ncbi:MAG TPA: DUF2282 domain-containing protein [Dongiaceae bacterium]|nr:DUF2282 domain-containing protein [Dongiaceae bacterium]
MKTTLILAGAVAAALSAPLAGGPAAAAENEKCYGVAAADQNDCQTANNSCAGHSALAGQSDAWVYVPAGTCARINGGSLEPKNS